MTVFGGSRVRPNIHIDDLVGHLSRSTGARELSTMPVSRTCSAGDRSANRGADSRDHSDPALERSASCRRCSIGSWLRVHGQRRHAAIDELAARFAGSCATIRPSTTSLMKQHSLSGVA
jgi:hypothetical protein